MTWANSHDRRAETVSLGGKLAAPLRERHFSRMLPVFPAVCITSAVLSMLLVQ